MSSETKVSLTERRNDGKFLIAIQMNRQLTEATVNIDEELMDALSALPGCRIEACDNEFIRITVEVKKPFVLSDSQ